MVSTESSGERFSFLFLFYYTYKRQRTRRPYWRKKICKRIDRGCRIPKFHLKLLILPRRVRKGVGRDAVRDEEMRKGAMRGREGGRRAISFALRPAAGHPQDRASASSHSDVLSLLTTFPHLLVRSIPCSSVFSLSSSFFPSSLILSLSVSHSLLPFPLHFSLLSFLSFSLLLFFRFQSFHLSLLISFPLSSQLIFFYSLLKQKLLLFKICT